MPCSPNGPLHAQRAAGGGLLTLALQTGGTTNYV